jgi:hypothetical protein
MERKRSAGIKATPPKPLPSPLGGPTTERQNASDKLLEDRLDEAYYRREDVVRGRTRSERKEVGLEEDFGVLPTSGPMVKAPLDDGGQGLGRHLRRSTARNRSAACRRLGWHRVAVKTRLLVSTMATAPKISPARSARREKVAIGIHYLAIAGGKSIRCHLELRWAHNVSRVGNDAKQPTHIKGARERIGGAGGKNRDGGLRARSKAWEDARALVGHDVGRSPGVWAIGYDTALAPGDRPKGGGGGRRCLCPGGVATAAIWGGMCVASLNK